MQTPWLIILLFSLSYLSCKTKTNSGSVNGNEVDTTKFFQVKQYIQSQINEVNSTPFFIYQINVKNERRDSIPINTQIFNQIAKQFLTPDINDEKLKPNYAESIFEDQTTKGFTINYTTNDKLLELQSVDILLDEDGKKVKRVFLRKFFGYPDSSAIEQLSWKPGESFQVNRSVQNNGGSESMQQTTVVWGKK